MNYTQIKSGSRSFPCYYGTAAIASLEERGIDIGHALDSMQSGKLFFHHGLAITYEGIKEGHRRAGKDFLLSESDIGDWIDEDLSIINKCIEVLAKSNFMQGLIKAAEERAAETPDEQGNGVKKKLSRSRELMKSRK